MNQGKRHGAMWGPKLFASLFLLSTQLLFANPAGRSDTKQAASGPVSVAIVPFVFIGRADEQLTDAFRERLVSLKMGSRIMDDASVTSHLIKGVNWRSDASFEALLAAAKASSAEVLILGEASNYTFLDAPGINLRVRVIAVESGSELQNILARETSWTLPGAKSQASETAAKKIVKQWLAK